jgi:hypothetical protein
MEFIEGTQLLAPEWVKLNDQQRENILSGMIEQLQLLRSIPSEGYYGRVNGQGFHPLERFVRTKNKGVSGPFRSHEDLLSAMYGAAEVNAAFRCSSKDDVMLYRPEQLHVLSRFKNIFRNCAGREPKFTHVDLLTQNMVVRPLDGDMRSASKFEVTIIDWSGCGWFPAWVQPIRFGLALRPVFEKDRAFEEEWKAAVEQVHERAAQYFEEDYTEAAEFWKEGYYTCNFSIGW